MTQPVHPGLCPHKQNPKACLICWRLNGQPVGVSQPAHGHTAPLPVAGKPPAPEAFSGDKLWEPPAHPSVIDRAPRRR